MLKKPFVNIFLLLAVNLGFCAVVAAETVELASGKVLEAAVVEKTANTITIDYKGGLLTYKLDEIKSIDGRPVEPGSAPSAPPASDEQAIRPLDEFFNFSADPSENLLRKADALLQENDFTEAVSRFTQAIAINPKSQKAYKRRAFAYLRLLRFNLALTDLNKAISLDPKDAESYSLRSFANAYLHKPDDAIKDAGQFIELTKANIEQMPTQYAMIYSVRAGAYFEKGDFVKALNDFDKVISLDETYPDVYSHRGNVYYQMGSTDEAIKDFDKAISLNPQDSNAYYLRGLIYLKKMFLDQAVEDFSKAIEIDPRLDLAYRGRAAAYQEQANYDPALKDLSKAIELNPAEPSQYGARAMMYFFKKDFDKAWEDVRQQKALGGKPDPGFIQELQAASGRLD